MDVTPDEFKGRKAVVKDVTKLVEGAVVNLRDWHLAASAADGVITMVALETEKTKDAEVSGYEVQPGAWRVTPKQGLQHIHFSDTVYYETPTSHKLMQIFNTFKTRLDVYDKLGITSKKRGVLLGSEPGSGKSSLLNYFCRNLIGKDEQSKACVLYIDNQDVDFEIIQTMFRKLKPGTVDFVVLIIEDIGGSDLNERNHRVDSTMLNFLDGQDGLFVTPTLVVATTNFLDLLGNTITSRPGRFDIVLQVDAPSETESIALIEDFMKRKLTQEEREAVAGQKFTPAYLRECVIRHMLDDIPFPEAVKQLAIQRKAGEGKTHTTGRSRKAGFSSILDEFDDL